jgi:hypothetical protein
VARRVARRRAPPVDLVVLTVSVHLHRVRIADDQVYRVEPVRVPAAWPMVVVARHAHVRTARAGASARPGAARPCVNNPWSSVVAGALQKSAVSAAGARTNSAADASSAGSSCRIRAAHADKDAGRGARYYARRRVRRAVLPERGPDRARAAPVQHEGVRIGRRGQWYAPNVCVPGHEHTWFNASVDCETHVRQLRGRERGTETERRDQPDGVTLSPGSTPRAACHGVWARHRGRGRARARVRRPQRRARWVAAAARGLRGGASTSRALCARARRAPRRAVQRGCSRSHKECNLRLVGGANGGGDSEAARAAVGCRRPPRWKRARGERTEDTRERAALQLASKAGRGGCRWRIPRSGERAGGGGGEGERTRKS